MEIIGCHDHPSRQSIAMVDGQAETRHHVSKSTTDGQTGAAARERGGSFRAHKTLIDWV